MKFCCCSLAGTGACKTCSNNPNNEVSNMYIYTVNKPLAKKYCVRCGTPLQFDYIYCPQCGSRVN